VATTAFSRGQQHCNSKGIIGANQRRPVVVFSIDEQSTTERNEDKSNESIIMFGGGRRDKPDSLSQAMQPENSPGGGGGSKAKQGSSVTGFDPEGLERAAKAARELDASRNANAAIELIKTQEVTKQHEAATRRAEMDAYTQQQRAVNIEAEANEARKTLDAQTVHEKQRMEYHDQLERKRQVDMLNAQKYMQQYVVYS
jgi:ATPase family AAA domain-containing protein 3A/B